jgi:hypothetical protein
MKGYTPQTCPGISKFVRPVPEYFACPSCGGDVEIWSDEDIGVCMSCSKKVSRSEKVTSCLDWCPQADKCREIIVKSKTEK